LKFTEQGSVIVSTAVSERDSDRVVLEISVMDTGIGMHPTQVDRLFQPFAQADASTTRRFGGTGLGLTISRRLVNLMGGSMNVTSVPGFGSTFSFTSVFEPCNDERTSWSFQPELSNIHALIVEPSPPARHLLKSILDSFSFVSDTALSGEAALDLMLDPEAPIYDLLLLDWKSLDEGGLNIADAIKSALGPRAPVIILMTANTPEYLNVHERTENRSIDDFLARPVQQSVLFETILKNFRQGAESTTLKEKSARTGADYSVLRGARVLLVEDNELNLQVASEILESRGVWLTCARDGSEALDLIDSESAFDAVLMDVQMPVLDGYEATRRLREKPAGKNLPVIAMTATAMKDDIRRAMEAGMDAHIAKPIHPDRLLRVLSDFILHGQAAVSMHGGAGPATAEEDSHPEATGIDFFDALKRLGGNRAKLRSLLRGFAAEFGQYDRRIESAIRAQEWSDAERLAHTLRGVAANLSINSVARDAGRLEEILRAADVATENSGAAAKATRHLASALEEALTGIEILAPSVVRASPESLEATQDSRSAGLPGEICITRLKTLAAQADTAALHELERLQADFI
ncbi:MAG: response regulator, partial [Leptospirales bacterium]